MTTMTTSLDKTDFEEWLKSPITQELFKVFTENFNEISETMLGLDAVNDTNLERRVSYLSGGLQVYRTLKNLTFEQMFITEEEKSNEETPYSW